MKIEYTKKLFFRKHAYRLTFKVTGWSNYWYRKPKELKKISDYIAQNLNDSDIKIRCRFQDWKDNMGTYYQCVYCKDSATKDNLLSKFGSQVIEVCQPLDDTHKDDLEVKNIIEVRKELIYKKYRYAVYFKYDKTHQIMPWLKKYFRDQQTVSKVTGDKWFPRLYLVDDAEIVSIRLSWQDKIDYIKTVRILEPTPTTTV